MVHWSLTTLRERPIKIGTVEGQGDQPQNRALMAEVTAPHHPPYPIPSFARLEAAEPVGLREKPVPEHGGLGRVRPVIEIVTGKPNDYTKALTRGSSGNVG